jgi:hypothetical protein
MNRNTRSTAYMVKMILNAMYHHMVSALQQLLLFLPWVS